MSILNRYEKMLPKKVPTKIIRLLEISLLVRLIAVNNITVWGRMIKVASFFRG
jgi:hypothetical protein